MLIHILLCFCDYLYILSFMFFHEFRCLDKYLNHLFSNTLEIIHIVLYILREKLTNIAIAFYKCFNKIIFIAKSLGTQLSSMEYYYIFFYNLDQIIWHVWLEEDITFQSLALYTQSAEPIAIFPLYLPISPRHCINFVTTFFHKGQAKSQPIKSVGVMLKHAYNLFTI